MNSSEALKIILAEAGQGNLNFPTSAKVAFRVSETLDGPECSLDEAVRLVKAEPLIASRVVALASSISYNSSGKKITDVRAAVLRLGFGPVRAAAVAVATRQMAGTSTDPAIRERATKLRELTMHMAALANVIARRVTKQDPEATCSPASSTKSRDFTCCLVPGSSPACSTANCRNGGRTTTAK